ncbi:hypothetical protein CYY_004056 [Polysphondylium violaceum]|uniref:Transmembrane protein n=1 Tax=Polysphondylium violaceum TaxID=133409 RepID=A0A8J4PW19_9MYCE|nr:hypothetical protein CYY_004056 [Polysphondylium violaceum]
MNRQSFYAMGLVGAGTMVILAGTPICRPTFGAFLGANKDQQDGIDKIKAVIYSNPLDLAQNLHHHDKVNHHGH